MTDEQFADAQALWKLFYGAECFLQVEKTVNQMAAMQLDTHHQLYYPLLVSVYVLYGRPFKRARGVGKLSNDVVPPPYLELHGQLLDHRDQLYAHTDAGAPEIADRGRLNQVRFLVTEKEDSAGTWREFQLFAPQFKTRPVALTKVGDLCRALHPIVNTRINKLQRRLLGSRRRRVYN